ncbi:HEAT repeat domain-containing protein [uncultured Deinococcus sp.]|uniref:HEAT repeat domain-containing protein n=1 Tax=uncultured Deinococcus sp. TaxID=158789 RepID=UPI0025E7B64B|nr:HEAT repeat domain-containing protein [uncultured Deinococcus sp.]
MSDDVLDATKEALTAEFAAALHGRPDQVLPALNLAASASPADYGVTTEFPTLLLAALTHVDQDGHVLVHVASDRRQPWFLRNVALRALAARSQPDVIPLFRQVLRDNGAEGALRSAAMRALVELGDTESLELIRTLSARGEPWFGAAGPLQEARGQLGDLTATRNLITLAADPSLHRSAAGRTGLAALEAQVGGLDPLVQALQGEHLAPDAQEPGSSAHPVTRSLVNRLHPLAITDAMDAVRNWATTRLANLEPARAAEVLLQAL